jgi:hypothetical protein
MHITRRFPVCFLEAEIPLKRRLNLFTVTLFKEINDAFPTPIQPIANTTLSLITTVRVMNLLSRYTYSSQATDSLHSEPPIGTDVPTFTDPCLRTAHPN